MSSYVACQVRSTSRPYSCMWCLQYCIRVFDPQYLGVEEGVLRCDAASCFLLRYTTISCGVNATAPRVPVAQM